MSIADKLTVIAENQQRVYDAGYAKGKAEGGESGGGDDGYYDTFWDVFQANGDRVNYYYAFSYDRFSDKTYNPKYTINTKSGTTTCRHMFFQNTKITDTKVPIYANGGNVDYAFQGATNLVTIRELKVTKSQTFVTTFASCSALANITFTGTIGKDISFADSPNLTIDSLTSIVNALETKTDGGTYTLTLHSTAKARLTDGLKQTVTDKGWQIK